MSHRGRCLLGQKCPIETHLKQDKEFLDNLGYFIRI